MGKRGKPKRIIRCSKPTVCPECGNRKFLIVVYGMPTQKVWDDTGRYDCRGCCLPPFVEVVTIKMAIYIIAQSQNMYVVRRGAV